MHIDTYIHEVLNSLPTGWHSYWPLCLTNTNKIHSCSSGSLKSCRSPLAYTLPHLPTRENVYAGHRAFCLLGPLTQNSTDALETTPLSGKGVQKSQAIWRLCNPGFRRSFHPPDLVLSVITDPIPSQGNKLPRFFPLASGYLVQVALINYTNWASSVGLWTFLFCTSEAFAWMCTHTLWLYQGNFLHDIASKFATTFISVLK